MVREGEGRVLVDERDLWPDGEFVTTHLIVATEFLESHPGVVRDLLAGHVAAVDYLNDNPDESQRIVAEALADLTGAQLPEGTLAAAWENLTFTVDPIADSLAESAADAVALGLLEDGDIEGIYDLNLLNEVLGEAGRPEVMAP
jgi:NitT/TauT family transport system substrate-binding protein